MTDVVSAEGANRDWLSLHQGLRTAIAAELAYSLTELFHMPGGYWAAISAIVVMQSEVGATWIASRDRVAGTAIGSLIGLFTGLVWHNWIVVFALAVLVVMVLCTALRLQNAGRLGGVAVAIMVLIPRTQPIWHIAMERFLEVSFGIVVSLAVAVVWTKAGSLARPVKRRPNSSAARLERRYCVVFSSGFRER